MNDIREMVEVGSREIDRENDGVTTTITLEYTGKDTQGQGWRWYGRLVKMSGVNVGYDEWGFEPLP